MRVFQINDSDAYAGKTMLQAVKAAASDADLPMRDVFDRNYAEEIPREAWPFKMIRDLTDEAVEKYITLESIMADVREPGMVLTSNC